MNKITYTLIVGAIIIASILSLPLIFKGVIISAGMIGLALILAAIFLLGMLVAIALLSPLWIPFVAGYAAVRFCKQYYYMKKESSDDKAVKIVKEDEKAI